MADRITIRLATEADVAALNAALRALSADLGDTHRATDGALASAGFGALPAFRAVLALRADTAAADRVGGAPVPGAAVPGAAVAGTAVVGAAVFSPLYSTTRGFAGAYVSDLWVAGEARGSGLGPRLLARVRDEARGLWGAGFIRLAVYGDNAGALAFYERLGFAARTGEIGMILEGAALDAMGGSR